MVLVICVTLQMEASDGLQAVKLNRRVRALFVLSPAVLAQMPGVKMTSRAQSVDQGPTRELSKCRLCG